MTKAQKVHFENIVNYCNNSNGLIPITFVLGFYVGLVMKRWWDQYMAIPWPDSIAVFVSGHVRGQDEHGRMMRRTVMRYVCLCLTIVFSMVAPSVKRRFPDLDHFVEAGLMNDSEKQVFEKLNEKFPMYPKHWMPIVWAGSIMIRARKEGRIWDDYSLQTIMAELNSFRGLAGFLLFYDFISVPLVYTQVVTWAVYSYTLCTILARQPLDIDDAYHSSQIDKYFPVFATLEFFFYVGWLKVAESLICPFGEDDDDFELNWMIDRNLQISYLIVDEMHHDHPDLVKDQYWDEVFPIELPYATENAMREQPPEASTARLKPVEGSVQQIYKRASKVRYTPSTISAQRRLESAASVDLIDEVVIKDSVLDTPPARKRSKESQPVSRRASTETLLVIKDSVLNTPPAGKRSKESQPISRRASTETFLPAEAEKIDYFQLLKAERARERAERHQRRFSRSVGRNIQFQAAESEFASPISYKSLSEIDEPSSSPPAESTKKDTDTTKSGKDE